MGLNNRQNPDLGHYLLFENESGDGELVSAQSIGKLMNKTKHEIDVVFVAACDS